MFEMNRSIVAIRNGNQISRSANGQMEIRVGKSPFEKLALFAAAVDVVEF
jgi:hypothetical protein